MGIYSGDYKVGADYRNQWGSITAPFQTALISGEARIVVNREIGDYISFGLAASYDKAGSIDFTSVEVYPAINYNKALEDVHNTYLSVGLTGGYIARTVDMSKATFSSQYVGGNYSSSNPTGETAPFKSLTNYDVGAGVSINSSIGSSNKFNYYVRCGIVPHQPPYGSIQRRGSAGEATDEVGGQPRLPRFYKRAVGRNGAS